MTRSPQRSSASWTLGGCLGSNLGVRPRRRRRSPCRRNAATGRGITPASTCSFSGGAVVQHGYPCQSWLTFRQALALGGHVRRGEHGTTVVYADRFIARRREADAPAETGEDAQAIPFLKRFTVFNALQCEGLPDEMIAMSPLHRPKPGLDRAARWRRLSSASGIDFPHRRRSRLLRIHAQDFVQVPPPASVFRADQLASNRPSRDRSHASGHSLASPEPRPFRLLRFEEVRLRGVGRRNLGGVSAARPSASYADRAARRLHRLLGSRFCAKTTAPLSAPRQQASRSQRSSCSAS